MKRYQDKTIILDKIDYLNACLDSHKSPAYIEYLEKEKLILLEKVESINNRLDKYKKTASSAESLEDEKDGLYDQLEEMESPNYEPRSNFKYTDYNEALKRLEKPVKVVKPTVPLIVYTEPKMIKESLWSRAVDWIRVNLYI